MSEDKEALVTGLLIGLALGIVVGAYFRGVFMIRDLLGCAP